jgi:hypothetical protein
MTKKSEWDVEIRTMQLNLRISPDFIRAIDNWRRKQEDLPGRSEAVRRLVEIALKAKPK